MRRAPLGGGHCLPGNALLAAARGQSLERLLAHAESVALPHLAVLCDAGEAFSYAWFPHRGIVSAVLAMEDGAQVEIGAIGPEGCVGVEAVLTADYALARYVVTVPAMALRVPFAQLRMAITENAALHAGLMRYAQAVTLQSHQLSGCNTLHRLDQRCARWLLMAHDRIREDEFFLTHECLAAMLGVRRASVTEVTGRLQDAGLIRRSRSRVRVLDRAGLEAHACECYRAIRRAYDRLLPGSFGI